MNKQSHHYWQYVIRYDTTSGPENIAIGSWKIGSMSPGHTSPTLSFFELAVEFGSREDHFRLYIHPVSKIWKLVMVCKHCNSFRCILLKFARTICETGDNIDRCDKRRFSCSSGKSIIIGHITFQNYAKKIDVQHMMKCKKKFIYFYE